jgi:TPR repeat protein
VSQFFKKSTLCVLSSLVLLSGCTNTGELPDLKTAKRALNAGDIKRAESHYEILAKKDYPEAQMQMAKISLMDKEKLSPEEKLRLTSLLEKAGTNEPKAYEILADLALSEKPSNPTKAVGYYKKAYEAGSKKAALKIGDFYAQHKQAKEAILWFSKSYNGGEPKAIYRIGRIYETGKIVKRDMITGLAYYLWSQELGVTDSAKGIARLSLKLSPADQKKAADLLPQLKTSLPISE